MYEVEADAIEEMVQRTLDELPHELRERLDNLAIVVEDAATSADYALARPRGGTLLGVYRRAPNRSRFELRNDAPRPLRDLPAAA